MATNLQKGVAWVMICTPLVGAWEGLYLRTYKDGLAHNLLTVCYGMTPYDRPVHLGDVYTKEQCQKFLAEDLPKYYNRIAKCITADLTSHQIAAAVSLSYNIGASATCKSMFIRALNAGDPKACDYLLQYTHASGRFVQGLLNRRNAERRVCYTEDI